MRDLKTSKGIKYILEDRALSVDAPNSLSNKEVTDLSNRVGIIDRIITTKFDEFKELEAKDLRSHIRIAHIFTHRKNQFARKYNDLFEKQNITIHFKNKNKKKKGMLKLVDRFHLGWNGCNPCKFKSCYLQLCHVLKVVMFKTVLMFYENLLADM